MPEEEKKVQDIKPNLILKNGAIYTVDDDRSWGQAIAISDDKIVFVGSNKDVEPFIESDTVVIDLDGKMVLPAFVDSHMHPAHSAHLYQNQLSLFDVTDKEQIRAYLNAVKEFAERNLDAPWIIGAGYARSAFDEVGPRKEWLDEVDSERWIS